jgi:phosphoadenosine phosphosulfate reductase
MIILHQLPDDIPLLFLDTLDHFPETYRHYENTVKVYTSKKFHRYLPVKKREDLDLLFEKDSDAYAWFSKVEPLERALRELKVDAIITGRRRDQDYSRKTLELIETDSSGRFVINPLYDWTFSDVKSYLKEHPEIPLNKLHSQGYTSIGDVRTTEKPIDETERSGRWIGSNQKECGIHNRRDELKKIFDVK